MINSQLIPSDENWREKSEQSRVLLEKIRTELVEAEAQLAERLTAINAFEFQLRLRLEPLLTRLESIENDIRAYTQQLRQASLDPDLDDLDEPPAPWRPEDFGRATHDQYRYRSNTATAVPPKPLNPNESAKIKQLYRQLARRFHPDMALNDEDRQYRTQMMMAINAAYASNDLAKLRQIALEPDPAGFSHSETEQQIAEMLWRELAHCQSRLAEVRQEIARLEAHKSAKLLRRAEEARVKGRDLIAEIAADLREKISERLVERDILEMELDEMAEAHAMNLDDPDFLDDTFEESLLSLDLELGRHEEQIRKQLDRSGWSENDEDGEWGLVFRDKS